VRNYKNMKTIHKNIEYLYEKLLEIAISKNVDIYTNFTGKKSVLWNLRGRKILLLNEKFDIKTKLKIVCKVLKTINLDDVFITPYLRELIDKSDSPKKEQISVCKICNKKITENSYKLVNVCKNCFKYQIKFGLSFENCSKKTTDKDCFECPHYDECNVVLERLYPNHNKLEQAGIINNSIFERIERTKNYAEKNFSVSKNRQYASYIRKISR
jgi:hypothetical protein